MKQWVTVATSVLGFGMAGLTTHEALSYITVSICQVMPCSRVSCHTEGENNPLIGWWWFLEVSLSHLVQSVAKKVLSLVSTMLPWLPVVFPVSANTRQLLEVSTSTCWLQQAQP